MLRLKAPIFCPDLVALIGFSGDAEFEVVRFVQRRYRVILGTGNTVRETTQNFNDA